MTNYLEAGRRMQWTNATSVAVAAGGIVALTDRIAVAINAIAVGASGTICLEDVYTLPATVAETWTVGQALYFVVATGFISNVAGANIPAGFAYAAKAPGTATGQVKINA